MTDLDNFTESQPAEQVTPTSAHRRVRADVFLLLLLVILIVGAYFRLLNVNWDEGEHLHPDERYMTMATGAIRSPESGDAFQNPPAGCASWGGYFDSYCSPLNPHNHEGFGSYAYGTFPLFSARIIGEWLSRACIDPANPDAAPSGLQRWIASLLFTDVEGCVGNRFTDYGHINILGRTLSALADLGALLFAFLIGRRLYGPWIGLLAVALYALAALPIQQSHFYTVDSFAGFFIAVAGYFAVRGAQDGGWLDFALAGLTLGLAVASKVSVWPFAAVIALAALLHYARSHTSPHTSPVLAEGQAEGNREEPARVLDWLMVLLVVVLVFLIAAIAILGIWSAVKIAFFFAIALLLLAAITFYAVRPDTPQVQSSGTVKRGISVDGALLRLLVAGIFAFLAFRIAQPYAFVGTNFDVSQWQAPEYDWLRANVPDLWYTLDERLPEPLRTVFLPDPRFIGALGSVNRQLTGEADVPWGHQWTNRLPFVFPWVNMVVWGMGLPLGLAVWAGWGLAGWELWRGKRRLQHFIPWAWVTILFFYQGTQWVKSIRYLLPTYPFLMLLGAWFLARLWRKARGGWSVVYRLPLIIVLVGAFLWAWGFTRIYTHPVTRNTASRWMTENIPTAATLHYEVGGQVKTQFLRMPATYTYEQDGLPQISPFVLPEPGIVTGITFTHLGDPDRDAATESFEVVLAADVNRQNLLAEAERTINLEQAQHRLGDAQYFDLGSVPLEGEREYFVITTATAGAPVQLETTVIANEYPDDSLPTRVDRRDPYGGTYRGLKSSGDGKTHWDLNEDANKLAQALEWLDEADIIALSSNRGYASIPRLPSRFPLAIEYYRALFAEELGFELIATFASYPTIGPFQFPDQETPFPPGEPTQIREELGSFSIHLPPAEEAFSVYDHPQVFLFRKTEAYSRQRVEQILGGVNLDGVVWMKPTEATLAPTALMHSAQELEIQRSGGTWTEIFDVGDWLNDSPWLGLVVWWVMVQAVGLFAFPLLFFTAPGLRDRGWPLAKTLGLLLLATLVWLAVSTKFASYSRPLILFVLLLMAALGVGLAWWQRRELAAWFAETRRTILISELVFNGMFLLFLLIRYGNPDLWHPAMGGERPMDFAYLNAVIKSTHFPPYDPWFAGGYLNYYYFGFVIVGTPIKLLGILPEIAYNFILPTFFALTGAGAFSVAFNLTSSVSGKQLAHGAAAPARRAARYAIYAGLVAALFVALLGNLAEIKLVADGLHTLGSRDFQFQSTIPGLEPLVVSLRGVVKHTLGGEPMPWRAEWPYWNASRAIPHPDAEAPPITEFPFFTFLYSDLHAHLLVLPLTLLALAYIVHWTLHAGFWRLDGGDSDRRWTRRLSGTLGLVIGAIVIGSLRPTNTWDYSTYLALVPLALMIGYAVHQVGLHRIRLDFRTIRNGVAAVGGRFGLLAALSYLFFLPYISRYATASTGFRPWQGSKTPLWAYFGVHGLFLFPIFTWLLLQVPWPRVVERVRSWGDPSEGTAQAAEASPTSALTVFSLVLLLPAALFAFVAGYQVALIVLPFGFLALAVLMRRNAQPVARLVALVIGVGLILTLFVEVMVLNTGDVGRMNTVFKFYLQAWVLFGIASAVCLVWIRQQIQGSTASAPREATVVRIFNPAPATGNDATLLEAQVKDRDASRTLWQVWKGILALLLVLAALYPILATRAKINDRWAREAGPGLDSLAWMKVVTDTQFGEGAPEGLSFPLRWDYEALMWLRENVEGSPVVAEGAKAPPYRSLRGRVATYTGLPIIIGYDWHQKQQRSFLKGDLIDRRVRDVNELFSTTDPWRAKEILNRYDASLVYVGDLERAHYSAEGVAKFVKMAEMGLLRSVYTNPGVTIYEVVQ